MLPKLTISDHVIERRQFIKFLGVLLDEHLNWQGHIKCTENKMTKKIRTPLYSQTYFKRECLTSSLLLIYANLHKLCQYSLGQYLQDKP